MEAPQPTRVEKTQLYLLEMFGEAWVGKSLAVSLSLAFPGILTVIYHPFWLVLVYVAWSNLMLAMSLLTTEALALTIAHMGAQLGIHQARGASMMGEINRLRQNETKKEKGYDA